MKTKTVIICDDDEGIVDVATIVLTEAGYTVISVTNSSHIFELINAHKPHIILLDLSMPDMSGEDICRNLKSDPATKHIPLIIVSASRDTQDVAKNAGADGFISKPFDIEELEKVVRKFTDE